MADDTQRDAVRYDLGGLDDTQMPDPEIDTLYTRAEAKYGAGTDASEAWVRVLAIRSLMAQAATRVDYRQNQSEEKLSQMLPALEKLEQRFLADLKTALGSTSSLAKWGALRKVMPRAVELPDSLVTTSPDSSDISRLQ